jgi:hypothetical protein
VQPSTTHFGIRVEWLDLSLGSDLVLCGCTHRLETARHSSHLVNHFVLPLVCLIWLLCRSWCAHGVGLFVASGAVILAITLVWVKGTQIRAQTRKYEAVFEFQQAQGITVGTPVRIRGVDVGNVVQVRPSLERIDVVVELSDTGIVVPRNALVEVNQSGLISETLIDVTPIQPLPKPTVGPLDPYCPTEGLIVCDRERIKGQQGVSLDELVGICTKIARQMDALGVDRVADMAERLSEAVQDARPLLLKVRDCLLHSPFSPLLVWRISQMTCHGMMCPAGPVHGNRH